MKVASVGKRFLASCLMLCIFFLGVAFTLPPQTVSAEQYPVVGEAVYIQNLKSFRYLDVSGGVAKQDAHVIQWEFTGKKNQQWRFVDLGLDPNYVPEDQDDLYEDDDYYDDDDEEEQKGRHLFRIESMLDPTYVLSVSKGSTKNGAKITIQKNTGGDHQKWWLESFFDCMQLRSAHTDFQKGINVANGNKNNGANMVLWKNKFTESKQNVNALFQFDPVNRNRYDDSMPPYLYKYKGERFEDYFFSSEHLGGILNQLIKPKMNDRQKMKAIYDFLIFQYVHSGQKPLAKSPRITIKPKRLTAVQQQEMSKNGGPPQLGDVFAEGEGECTDFAYALYLLANLAGVECETWGGLYVNRDGTRYIHAWNRAKVNGTWYWYDVDVEGTVYRRGGTVLYYLYEKQDQEWKQTHEQWTKGGTWDK